MGKESSNHCGGIPTTATMEHRGENVTLYDLLLQRPSSHLHCRLSLQRHVSSLQQQQQAYKYRYKYVVWKFQSYTSKSCKDISTFQTSHISHLPCAHNNETTQGSKHNHKHFYTHFPGFTHCTFSCHPYWSNLPEGLYLRQ